MLIFEIPETHQEHWMEPQDMTQTREAKDTVCKHCGEDIPWHNVSCKLLKMAYQNRKAQCSWCDEMIKVGEDMWTHNHVKHMDKLKELEAQGVKFGKRYGG